MPHQQKENKHLRCNFNLRIARAEHDTSAGGSKVPKRRNGRAGEDGGKEIKGAPASYYDDQEDADTAEHRVLAACEPQVLKQDRHFDEHCRHGVGAQTGICPLIKGRLSQHAVGRTKRKERTRQVIRRLTGLCGRKSGVGAEWEVKDGKGCTRHCKRTHSGKTRKDIVHTWIYATN